MPDIFLQLSAKEREQALNFAATQSGRPVHLLEKDVWVVWALETLFGAQFADQLVFKGGTSLSKAYGVIRRFSEDIDVTYDIRAILELSGTADPLPPTSSQQKKWTSKIRARLPEWIAQTVLPIIEKAISAQSLPTKVRAEGEKLLIQYAPIATGSGYVSPVVTIEFGARSTGEPAETRQVTCDAAQHLPNVLFPTATPRVMLPERTFWEKATAIHVFCFQGEFGGGAARFARHWYDIVKLDEAGFADSAIANKKLANEVATHKSIFFSEKDQNRETIDYAAAVAGGLRLVPEGPALASLAKDYEQMIVDGLLMDVPDSFEKIIERCRSIERKANTTG